MGSTKLPLSLSAAAYMGHMGECWHEVVGSSWCLVGWIMRWCWQRRNPCVNVSASASCQVRTTRPCDWFVPLRDARRVVF
ncbi:hypothetical protein E2C01_037719 [Portunus trituberculatus]|uniref:Uncharacterized protein n=1 Tax=Portunus trituberculatus TaxID=210409 RepID=A0A5B7FFQ1_PORTR|nr:hypothetical protein [Portunus trituberculatus]